ncbi:MAG: hypothetical protein NTW21_20550 [Verrucomicrobia bacterium]|nr:hypothetical protein [Verrucomicrobiota bacterium]
MTRWSVIIKAASVLVLVWAGVSGLRIYAGSKLITAARIQREIAVANFADWSDRNVPPDDAEAVRRDQELRKIAAWVNRLDFLERDKYRRSRADEAFFRKLDHQEKDRFVELTVMRSINRFLESFEAMPPKQRRQFIEQGLKAFAEGSTEENPARVTVPDADMLTKISVADMRAYLGAASADTKLKLAPLIEVVNEAVQGLRGNEFGPRHQE